MCIEVSNEMVFQKFDYSHLVDNRTEWEKPIWSLSWELIPESNNTIKVKVHGDTLSSYETCEMSLLLIGTSSMYLNEYRINIT